MTRLSLTYCPCPDRQTADQLGRLLLERKLAGCVQILSGIQSLYRWQDAIQCDQECSLLIKSTQACDTAVAELLQTEHPYDCPCIMQQTVTQVNQAYLDWLADACQS